MWDGKFHVEELSQLQAEWHDQLPSKIEWADKWTGTWNRKSNHRTWQVWASTAVPVLSHARDEVVCNVYPPEGAVSQEVCSCFSIRCLQSWWSACVSKQCLGRDLTLASSLSVDVHAGQIPLNCLEGIWSKAAELLKTEGAIVSAPGVGSDAKYVLSYSGQRPHSSCCWTIWKASRGCGLVQENQKGTKFDPVCGSHHAKGEGAKGISVSQEAQSISAHCYCPWKS